MAHTIEPAASGRAKCRGCGRVIPKGELRFGERLPNPFADEGDMTLWFHLVCGAYKRPEAFGEALKETDADVDERERLADLAARGLEHRRLPRVDGAERSPTGRAKCRSCHAAIPKDDWRIRLVYFEEGMFSPSGFIHLGCADEYLGTTALVERIEHFSPELSPDDLVALAAELA